MPAVLCTDFEKKLPSGITPIDLKSLTAGTDLKNKYVQATVNHRYQHNKKPVSSLKLELKVNDGYLLDVLAIGQVADDLDVCVKGDVLICLKFEVQACPGHYHRRYQIVLDDSRENTSLVWICKNNIKSKGSVKQTDLQKKYNYHNLADVKASTVVNVYGVVKFYKPPTKTRGSDYCCSVVLTDPSLTDPEDKLSCNIFSSSESNLPNLQIGNIVRFHRLKIQEFKSKKQGQNGPGFQWLIFRSLADRESSTDSYTFEAQDESKVNSLLEWWQTNANTMSPTPSKKHLSQIEPKEYFDLVCQVIRICDLDATTKCKLCRVWDGTKFNGSVKMIKEEEFNETVLEDGTLMEASSGLAVDVFIFDNHTKSADNIKPGDFIQLTNLHAAKYSDQIELTLHGGTSFNRGLVVLSRDSSQVKELEGVLNTIVRGNIAFTSGTAKVSSDVNISGKTVHPKLEMFTKSAGEKSIDTPEQIETVKSAFIKSLDLHKNVSVNQDGSSSVATKSDSVTKGKDMISRNEIILSDSDMELLGIDIYSQQAVVDSSEHIETSLCAQTEPEQCGDSSVWLSAYDDSDFEAQVPKRHKKIVKDVSLQDNYISSSGSSTKSQGMLSTYKKHTDNNICSFPISPHKEQNDSSVPSSQESFHTAFSLNNREVTVDKCVFSPTREVTVDKCVASLTRKVTVDNSVASLTREVTVDKCVSSPTREVTVNKVVSSPTRKVTVDNSVASLTREVTVDKVASSPTRKVTIDKCMSSPTREVTARKNQANEIKSQKTFLSLKRKLDPLVTISDASQEPLPINKSNDLPLRNDVLCFHTVDSNKTSSAVHSQNVVLVKETNRNSDRDRLLNVDALALSRCGLIIPDKTSSSRQLSSVNKKPCGSNEAAGVSRDMQIENSGQDMDMPPRCMLNTASILRDGKTYVSLPYAT